MSIDVSVYGFVPLDSAIQPFAAEYVISCLRGNCGLPIDLKEQFGDFMFFGSSCFYEINGELLLFNPIDKCAHFQVGGCLGYDSSSLLLPLISLLVEASRLFKKRCVLTVDSAEWVDVVYDDGWFVNQVKRDDLNGWDITEKVLSRLDERGYR